MRYVAVGETFETPGAGGKGVFKLSPKCTHSNPNVVLICICDDDGTEMSTIISQADVDSLWNIIHRARALTFGENAMLNVISHIDADTFLSWHQNDDPSVRDGDIPELTVTLEIQSKDSQDKASIVFSCIEATEVQAWLTKLFFPNR